MISLKVNCISLLRYFLFITVLLYSCGVYAKFCTQTNQCSQIVAKQRRHFPKVRAVLKGHEEFEENYFILLTNRNISDFNSMPSGFSGLYYSITKMEAITMQNQIITGKLGIDLNIENGRRFNYFDSDGISIRVTISPNDKFTGLNWRAVSAGALVAKKWREVSLQACFAARQFKPRIHDSGTFTLFPRGFNDVFGSGRYGSDVVQLNNFVADIKFAILEEANDYFIGETWLDGYLGLAPPYALGHRGWVEDDNIPALLQQLAHWLEKPIISISAEPNNTKSFKSIDITLGGLDTDHCQNNWRFSPQTGPGYTVRASHFMLQKDDTSQGIELDVNVFVVDVQEYFIPETMASLVFPLFGNMTKSWMGGIVIDDCDLSKYPNLTFSIGSEEINDSWKFNLTLTPADYIFYGSLSRTNEIIQCNLLLRNNTDESVALPVQFFSRHCLAYDIKHHLVGIADRKI